MEPEHTDAEPLGDEWPITPVPVEAAVETPAEAPTETPATGEGRDVGVDLSLYELPANGALLHQIQARRAERRREEEELEAAMATITAPADLSDDATTTGN
jgi:hypothetical protein